MKLPSPRARISDDDGTGPVEVDGTYEHLGADIIASVREETIGYEGMKVDRMLFEKFGDTVRKDETLADAVMAGQWDRVIDYVNREIFDKTEEYYTLKKLRQAAAVDRRLTLREILEKVFGLIPDFSSRKQTSQTPPPIVHPWICKPGEADAIPAIKHYFKAYATSNEIRDIIEGKRFADLATNPSFSTGDFSAVPDKYRNLIPEYVKDYVSLNQFAP